MNIVYSVETTSSGMNEDRVAKIDGKYYPFRFDVNAGQVRWGNAFAKHTEDGVKYVSNACRTLDAAINKL